MTYPLAQIEALKVQLKELPEPDVGSRSVSKQQAIRLLARDIARLQRKGYTLEQVAAVLSERGVDINAATLKSYLRRTKRRPRRGAQGAATATPRSADRAPREAARAPAGDDGVAPPAATADGGEPPPKHAFIARDDSDEI